MTTAPWYVNKWRDQADAAMQEYSDNGTAINFGYWTTLLVNGEATFRTDSKSGSARISSASTGGDGSASGGGPQVRDFDATTGEPLNWWVNGINVTVFYGNIGKDEKQANIPRLTKSWFQDNPQAKCPPRFHKAAREFKGSSGNRKQQKKKRERKVAAAAAAEDVDDDDDVEMLSSSSPN